MHISEFEKVTYLKIEKFDGRVIPLQPCYHGNSNWESWIDIGGKLGPLKIVGVASASYFAKAPERETDIFLEFVNLIVKRAYYPDIAHFEEGIHEDINNLATCVEKINLFHEIWMSDKNRISSRYISTELEYIFKVCRSLFDLLQEVAMKLWKRFQYRDNSIDKKELKPSFAKMVYHDNKLITTEQIAAKYSIPVPLAAFYERKGAFFDWLRAYRDKIAHGGNSFHGIFMMEEGFAISVEAEPFQGLHIWETSEVKQNGLGSVRALVSYAILNTIHALEDFAVTIQKIMKLPTDIAPGYNVFLRGETLMVLRSLHKYGEEQAWIGGGQE
ncbi:hypothetical protein [Salinicola sp. MIT1003]|uniref:hypothetical protein n=1 Tax=Salinicola sp. MIT1003 TaxID=1882734 RepID=UPI0008DE4B5E|nr:hypothetical protein [Salinicola sp. MIT1003]OHZ03009.1 hypothetical protein BC443_15070 [Salinicola sp. MIT1003]